MAQMESPKPELNYITDENEHKINTELKRLKQDPKYAKNYKELYGRKFELINEPKNKTDNIRIMNFNMLADGLSGYLEGPNDKTFIKVPKECLNFKYRGFRIIEEITRQKPDIVVIEECDQFKFLEHYLQNNSYKGIFKSKAKSPCTEIGQRIGLTLNADGIAIFWDCNKFEPINNQDVYKFGKDVEHKPLIDVVGLAIILKLKKSEKEIMIIGSHLKSAKDAEGETQRLLQLQYLLPTCNHFLKLRRSNDYLQIPIFFCADLNASPINSKGYPPYAYYSIVKGNEFNQLIENSEQQQQEQDNNNNDDDNDDKLNKQKTIDNDLPEPDEEKDKNQKNQLPQKPNHYQNNYGINLSSSYYDGYYKILKLQDKCEPKYTTWKAREKGTDQHTIDYIFYQSNKNIVLTHLLSIPLEKDINKDTYLPGWEYPSDHFSIMAMFAFK